MCNAFEKRKEHAGHQQWPRELLLLLLLLLLKS
jgi:hypothetical protein